MDSSDDIYGFRDEPERPAAPGPTSAPPPPPPPTRLDEARPRAQLMLRTWLMLIAALLLVLAPAATAAWFLFVQPAKPSASPSVGKKPSKAPAKPPAGKEQPKPLTADQLREQAKRQMTGLDFRQAERTLTTLIGKRGEDASAWRDRARVRLTLGKRNEALADANRATELAPEAPAGYRLRGRIHRSRQQPELALADLARAEQLGDRSLLVRYLQAECLMEMKRYGEAETHYTRILAMLKSDRPQTQPAEDSGVSAADVLTRRSAARYFQDKGEAALADVSAAIEMSAAAPATRRARLYRLRAELQGELGRHDEALKDLSSAILLAPTQKGYRLARAEAHAEAGHIDEAIADYAAAAKLDPDDFGLKLALWEFLIQHGRADDALERMAALGASDRPTEDEPRLLLAYLEAVAGSLAGKDAAKSARLVELMVIRGVKVRAWNFGRMDKFLEGAKGADYPAGGLAAARKVHARAKKASAPPRPGPGRDGP